MKNAFINFSLIALVVLCLFFNAAAQVKKTNEKAVEPTAKEAIKQVLLNGDIFLSAIPSCKLVGMSPEDKTILDYLSGVLSFQAAPESSNQVEFSFKQEKGKRNEIVWVCDLVYSGKDAEGVWSNGVRFKIRNADRKLMRESLMCIGTG
jgi:hypothetical protein